MKKVGIFQKIAKILVILIVFLSSASFCQGYTIVPMASPTSNTLEDVWGSSSNNVFAVGDKVILHYDGSTWTNMNIPSSSTLYSVWGSSATDVWAVGDVVLHYNGISWSQVNINYSYSLIKVFGFSSNDVWACGDYGFIYHYNGTSWSLVSTGQFSNVELVSMFGASANDLYLIGFEGTSSYTSHLIHYDGSTFSIVKSIGTRFLDIWSPDYNIYYICGSDVVYEYNKTSGITGIFSSNPYDRICGFNATDIIFCNTNTSAIYQFNGSAWDSIGVIMYMTALFSANDPANVFFVSFYGEIYHLDMTTGIKEETSLIKDFLVFPNPASSNITITLNSDQKVDIDLFSITGQHLEKIADQEKKSSINFDVSTLTKGIYLIKVSSGSATETKKLIIN